MATIIRRRKLGMSSVKNISAFSKTGIKWVRSDRAIPNDDVFIRWGCTANVPLGAKVINSAASIHQVANKKDFRRVLNDAKLCPTTWFNHHDVPMAELAKGVIVRRARHAQGRDIWLLHDHDKLANLCNRLGDYYISSYVDKQEEYRVFVMQGRAVCVARKTPANPDALAWNVAKGGRFDNVRWDAWPLKAIKVSIEAFNLSKLDFGGVDVMIDKDGECTILEINSAPSLTSPYRQECMAKGFDYLLTKVKERLPLVQDRGGYTKFIHPAVCDRALMTGGV